MPSSQRRKRDQSWRKAKSDFRPPRNLCASGKRRFPSEAAAVEEIVRLRDAWKGDPERRPRRAYFCGRCGGVHLTSLKKDNP